jgi:inosose dehydratase
MILGYTVWTWMIKHVKGAKVAPVEDVKYYFEQACKEISDLGYKGVENFDFIADTYADEPNEFIELMDKYGLKFLNLYNYFSENYAEDYKKTERYLKWMGRVGCRQMNIQAVMWFEEPTDRPADYARIQEYCDHSDEIGKMCRDYGVELVMHPHMHTHVYKEEEVKYFMENTDPAYVGLCLDTAHFAIGGIDILKAGEIYFDRLKYIHLKDVYPDAADLIKWKNHNYRALGDGSIDFKSFYDLLMGKGYKGNMTVELDFPRVCNYESAAVSRSYLRRVLHI